MSLQYINNRLFGFYDAGNSNSYLFTTDGFGGNKLNAQTIDTNSIIDTGTDGRLTQRDRKVCVVSDSLIYMYMNDLITRFTFNGTTLTKTDSRSDGLYYFFGPLCYQNSVLHVGYGADGLTAISDDLSTLITSYVVTPYAIVTDGTYVYIVDGSAGKLIALSYSAGVYTYLAEANTTATDAVYFSGNICVLKNDKSIDRYSFNGTSFTYIATIPNLGTFLSFSASADYLVISYVGKITYLYNKLFQQCDILQHKKNAHYWVSAYAVKRRLYLDSYYSLDGIITTYNTTMFNIDKNPSLNISVI